MIARFLEYFYTNKFDSKAILINESTSYTVADIKGIIKNQVCDKSNVTVNLSKCSIFDFVIEFVARIFTEKEIYIFKEQKRAIREYFEFEPINPDEVTVYFATSGSSGESKIVAKTLTNLFKESEDLIAQFPELKNLEFVSTTTLNHLFGFTFQFMLPMNSGGVINANQITLPDEINKNNVCLISTPSFLEILAKYSYKPKNNPKFIISAGAKLKDKIYDYVQTISKKTIEIYGSTETGIMAFRTSSRDNLKLFDNISLNKSESGIGVKTPYSKTSPVIIQDSIKVLKNSELIFLGRNDRVYKIQEKRVSADDIENIIKQIPYVKDTYVFKFNDKLACLSVLSDIGLEYLFKNGMVKLVKNIKMILRKEIDIIPQKWKFTDTLPYTSNGKIEKQEILDLFNLNLSMPLPIRREISENLSVVALYFYKNCNFFQGHFEKFPIVPGVIQLFLAQHYASKIYNIQNISGQYRKIKFKNIIVPNRIIDLVLEKSSKGIIYTYKDEEKTYSSGLLPTVGLEGKG